MFKKIVLMYKCKFLASFVKTYFYMLCIICVNVKHEKAVSINSEHLCKCRWTDLLLGNVIEWRMPEDVDLEGVEFKAMASGSHTLKTDFV